jgi:hypothetical protein
MKVLDRQNHQISDHQARGSVNFYSHYKRLASSRLCLTPTRMTWVRPNVLQKFKVAFTHPSTQWDMIEESLGLMFSNEELSNDETREEKKSLDEEWARSLYHQYTPMSTDFYLAICHLSTPLSTKLYCSTHSSNGRSINWMGGYMAGSAKCETACDVQSRPRARIRNGTW